MKEFYKKYLHNYGFLCVITSLLVNFLIECFSRRSLVEGFKYLLDSPLVFLYNSAIILLTLSIIFLVKRRIFFYSLITSVWLIFGLTNGIVLSNRVTPFTAVELKLLDSVIEIMDKYLTQWQIGLTVTLLVAVGVGLILAFIFAPKYKGKIKYRRNVPAVMLVVIGFAVLTKVAIKTNVVSNYFGNIAYAYLDYGFPYCFSNTLVNTGIDKPDNYSEAAINNIFKDEKQRTTLSNASSSTTVVDNNSNNNTADAGTTSEKKPNIIFLQLESFFDITNATDLQFSEDPIPFYRSLMEKYSSGYLSVPSVGAGTANTEFEVISGMNLQFFGPGEYPYKTILKKSTCESVNYDLKDLGYTTHAIHNNKGTFYTRQNVFKQLGFDTFTSLEYMNIDETTLLDWAKDKYLTEYIMNALNSTENQDFIYTISVQGHGDYPDYKIEDPNYNPVIKVTTTGDRDEASMNAVEYYTNQIHEMDAFVKQLVETLQNYDEDVVLVMYGDHLPSLGFEDSELKNKDIYQTEYVVWSNFDMPKEDKTLEAYQLTSDVLGRLGIHNGTLTKYHQLYKDSSDYQENLKLLQYDMLYGKKYIYGGVNPFKATDLKMGDLDIVIKDVSNDEDGNVIIKGENFTNSSRVYINGNEMTTVFVDKNTLKVEGKSVADGDSIRVGQVTVTDFVLSKTDTYIYNDTTSDTSEQNAKEQ